MITFRIKDQKEATKIHDALIGTPEYINSKIVLSEMTDGSGRFELFIGDENNNNIIVNIGKIFK